MFIKKGTLIMQDRKMNFPAGTFGSPFSGVAFSVGAIESVGVTHIGCKISGADDLEKCI